MIVMFKDVKGNNKHYPSDCMLFKEGCTVKKKCYIKSFPCKMFIKKDNI